MDGADDDGMSGIPATRLERKVFDFGRIKLTELLLPDNSDERIKAVETLLSARYGKRVAILCLRYEGILSGTVHQDSYKGRFKLVDSFNQHSLLSYDEIEAVYDLEVKGSGRPGPHSGGMAKLPVGLIL